MISAQEDFQFTIVEKSDKPNTEKTHLYVLQITNNTSSTTSLDLKNKNLNCRDEFHKQHTDFTFEFYNLERTRQISKISVSGNSSVKFYLKKIAPNTAPHSAWNCSAIEASNSQTNILTSIKMNSLVQDPTKVN